MTVVEKNKGKKIPYTVNENTIYFNDSLMLNLEKYEQDDGYALYVYADRKGCLWTTISTDMRYAARIDIPARRYEARQKAVYEDDMPVVQTFPVPFSLERCTLTLWAMEQEE